MLFLESPTVVDSYSRLFMERESLLFHCTIPQTIQTTTEEFDRYSLRDREEPWQQMITKYSYPTPIRAI